MGHELTGIDSNYLRDSHSLEEIREIINRAFNKLDIEDLVA